MIELDIPSLTQLVLQLFENSSNIKAFNTEQRRQSFIKGIKYRQLLVQLIGKKMTEGMSPKVQAANQRIVELNQRLKDVQETLKQYNKTVEDLVTLADILGQIVDLVSLVMPFHAMAKSPISLPSLELAFAAEPPTPPIEGYAGSDPNDSFSSADKLIVQGKGSIAELMVMPTGFSSIIPPYALSVNPLPSNSPLPSRTIIDRDDRIRILDTHNAPWRMICSLSIQGPNGNFIGTGWFAGPKTIITAGHCIYETRQMGGWASQIRVFPGRDGDILPYQTVSQRFEVPEEWVESGGTNPDYDYGVIHLDEPLGDKTGWFSIAVGSDDQLSGVLANLSGYPGDYKWGGRYQLFHSDKVSTVLSNRFFYTIDTFGGQSGTPVWIKLNDGNLQVVGIHTYGIGLNNNNQNSATRITSIILNDIKKWRDNQ
jgi:V8-like Glu-specific endopeptidase